VKRSSLLLSVFAGLLLIATGYFLLYPRPGLPDAPLRAMPPAIVGFVRVRMPRLLASEAWREIVVARKEDRGIQRVTRICGVNPLESLGELLAFAVPGEKELEVVVNARSSLSQAKLTDCVAKFSGGSMASFVYERVAGFDTVRGKKGNARAAFVGRDGIVAGGAHGVSAALRSLAGETGHAAGDPFLVELYAAIAQDADLALVARVPSHPKARAQLAQRLGLTEHSLRDSRALTLAVHLVDDRIRFHAQWWLKDGEHAAAAERRLSELQRQVLALPGLGLLGVAAPLRALRVERAGANVTLKGEVTAKIVNRTIDLLPALAALQGSPAIPEPTPSALPDAGSRAVSGPARDGGVR
jgi:hypothetical protein